MPWFCVVSVVCVSTDSCCVSGVANVLIVLLVRIFICCLRYGRIYLANGVLLVANAASERRAQVKTSRPE